MKRLFLQTFLNSPFTVYRIVKNLARQKEFIQEKIWPDLISAKIVNDGSLDENDFKKITGYYGLAVPAILGEAFCMLRGKKMTPSERMASTCQGAMTGLFDDFFDNQLLSEEELIAFIEKPEQLSGNSSNEKLFLHFYKTALECCCHPKLMQDHLYKVHTAQVMSIRQATPGITKEDINAITLQKGGASLVFYRTVFTNPLEKAEENMLYHMGGLMQLANDIFDVYKDQQQGIQTLVTTTTDIRDIRKLFTELLKEGNTAAYKANYPAVNIKKFLGLISLAIFSRCFVCLDQLEEKQRSTDNIFIPQRYTRKDMICDMDTVQNKWKSLMYYVRSAELGVKN
ncbi:MAG: class 1 isoprenoid biosynthesis enzyme [Ferruginibacter sp.]